jgi:hypothetical protein
MFQDFEEFIELLNKYKVEFVIIGGYALGFHGIPRFTGDIDIFIRQTHENAQGTLKAITEFYDSTMGLTPEIIANEKLIRFGNPPVRIDILKKIDGVTFDEVWETKVKGTFENCDVYYISRDKLIKNKKASSREKDIQDLNILSSLDDDCS